MPDPETIERAQRDKEEGKSPSTQAGEFVREEIHHVREGKHGARSVEQAIAIGLSKARGAGVRLALSRQTRGAARRRGRSSLHGAAMKAAHTKGREGLRRAAQKAVGHGAVTN